MAAAGWPELWAAVGGIRTLMDIGRSESPDPRRDPAGRCSFPCRPVPARKRRSRWGAPQRTSLYIGCRPANF